MGVLHLVPIYCGTSQRPAGAAGREAGRGLRPAGRAAPALVRSGAGLRLLARSIQLPHPAGPTAARHTRTNATRVLGVTGVDLFIPVLTYVFGEAQLDGRGGRGLGLPPGQPDLRPARRTATSSSTACCKEAIHELGHTYNLLHCHEHPCVMMSSTYVEDIDLKSDRFCPPCLRTQREAKRPA